MSGLKHVPIDVLTSHRKWPEGSIVRDKTFLDMCFLTQDILYTTLDEKTMAKWLSLSLEKSTKKLIKVLDYPRPDSFILEKNTQRVYWLLEKVHNEMKYYSPKVGKLSIKDRTKYDIAQKLTLWLNKSKKQNNGQIVDDTILLYEQSRLDILPELEQLLYDSIWYYTVRDSFYNKYKIASNQKWGYDDNKFIIDPGHHIWKNGETQIMYNKNNEFVLSW